MAKSTQESDTRVLSVRLPFMRHVEVLELATKHGMTPSEYVLYKLWKEPETIIKNEVKIQTNYEMPKDFIQELNEVRNLLDECFNYTPGAGIFKDRKFQNMEGASSFKELRNKLTNITSKYLNAK